METFEQLMYDLLEGGAIKRYHMKQTIKEQNVAIHSWRMAAILHSLWPDCRRELTLAVLFHDVSERVTGDIASPVKWANPVLAEYLHRMTSDEEHRLGIRFHLEVEEQHILSWVDKFEGAMYCLDELQMGNRKLNYTFIRYHAACCDVEISTVYSKRAEHMKMLQEHLVQRAVELNVVFPGDK